MSIETIVSVVVCFIIGILILSIVVDCIDFVRLRRFDYKEKKWHKEDDIFYTHHAGYKIVITKTRYEVFTQNGWAGYDAEQRLNKTDLKVLGYVSREDMRTSVAWEYVSKNYDKDILNVKKTKMGPPRIIRFTLWVAVVIVVYKIVAMLDQLLPLIINKLS